MKKIIVNNVKIVQYILKFILVTLISALSLGVRDSILKDLDALEPGFITSFYMGTLTSFLAVALIILTIGIWKAIGRINRCHLKELLEYDELPF